MAKQPGKSTKPPTAGTNPPASGTAAVPERLPAYFLSLTLEDIRCFGPKQTLDLSDGKGKPAPWTIILGLNGTGKTTLLQSLLAFQQLGTFKTEDAIEHFRTFSNQYAATLLRDRQRTPCLITLNTASGNPLTSLAAQFASLESTLNLWPGGYELQIR